MRIPPFRSLRFQLIAYVVLIEVTMLSIMVWNNVTMIYQTHADRLYDTATSIVHQFADVAGSDMVAVDYASLEEHASTLLRHPEVAYLAVLDTHNTPVVLLGSRLPNEIPKQDSYPTKVTDGVFDVAADISLAGQYQGRVLVGFSLNLMQTTINHALNRSIAIAVTEIFLSVLVTIILGFRLTRNLRFLAEGAKRVGEGDYTVKIPRISRDEIGLTAGAFNLMVEEISRRKQRIEESAALAKVISDTSIDAMLIYDSNRKILTANDSAMYLFGYDATELSEKDVSTLICQKLLKDRTANELFFDTSNKKIKEIVACNKEGRTFPAELFIGQATFGNKIIYAATFHDISYRKQAEEKLLASETRLRAILDNVIDAIITIDNKGIIKSWNNSAQRLFGYAEKDVIGQNVSLLAASPHQEQHDNYIADYVKSGKAKIIGKTRELYGQRKNGSSFPIEVAINEFWIGDNHLFTGILRDITERKQAEQELENYHQHLEQLVSERTAKLSAAIDELEAFSYSVSHDLRAPLRGIDGFSMVLLEDYDKNLDDQGKKYLHRIRAASQRMGQIIDDLLMLSRVSRSDFRFLKVDLSTLVQDVGENLIQTHADRKVEFIVQDNVHAQGDERLLRIMLENLLGNAWKFTRKVDNPRVEFGTKKDGTKKIYYIRDNGAGFDITHAGKLFQAFQRLHSPDEFEGTGIGLAIVQRIIQGHGGKIWVEAEKDKGAAFFFTLK